MSEILHRIENLTPSTKAQLGKMNVSQMMAHCNEAMETFRPSFKQFEV